MRGIFGLLSVLLALLLVGSLVKSQLKAPDPATATTPNRLPSGQSPQEVQKEFKEALDRAMQQPRPEADGTQEPAAGSKP